MSVVPNSREDHQHSGARSGPVSRSSTLPPVLFQLPNLAALPCDDAAVDPIDQPESLATEDAIQPTESQPLESAWPLAGKPALETEPLGSDTGKETIATATRPVAETPNPVAATRNDESLFDIWGTRAVVLALLTLVIGSAFVAARQAQDNSAQAVAVDADISMDDLAALDSFEVFEGVKVAAGEVNAEPGNSDNLTATGEPASAETAASGDEIASHATLENPTVEPAPAPTEPPAMQAATKTEGDTPSAWVGAVPASLASNRTESTDATDLPVEALKPADPETPTPDQAFAENPMSVSGPDASFTLPADSAVKSGEFAEPAIRTNELVVDAEPGADSPGAIRYSSTPNGISDWMQYLPSVPTTTAP